MMNIAYRLFHRYGQPKHCKDGNDKAFAQLFQVRHCVQSSSMSFEV